MRGKKATMISAIILSVMAVSLIAYRVVEPLGDRSLKQERVHYEGDNEEEHEHGGVVKLTNAEMEEFGVSIGTATNGVLHVYVTLPGEIVTNQDHLVHVVPRFPGVVKEVRKKIGDYVKRGDVLAVIESNESLAPYKVKSLSNGTVIEKHISVGEVLNGETEVYVIADLSTVWVNLSVYQEYLPLVREGQTVLISLVHEIPDVPARISYVSPVVDEHTRTGLARVVLKNDKGLWRPGLFVTGRIHVEEKKVPLLVLKTAIHTIDDQTCVFVVADEGFKPQIVTTGQSDEMNVEILAGLDPGHRYVMEGGFILKAELSKGAFGEGHAH